MPETPVYGFPFEHIDDVPGHSLRSPGPILAEAVESEIQRLDVGLRFFETVVFDTTGNHNFNKAEWPGLRGIRARCQAGGGGGGGTQDNNSDQASSSGGGAGGDYAEGFILENDIASTEVVTVGAGGDGGGPSSDGVPGSDSSFGNHVIARGGPGGFTRGPSTGFRGSTGAASASSGSSVGEVVFGGSGGTGGFSFGTSVISSVTADHGMRGMGGSSHLGGATRVIRGHDFGSSGGRAFGGGGSGQVSGHNEDGKTGGDGADGVVIIDIYV